MSFSPTKFLFALHSFHFSAIVNGGLTELIQAGVVGSLLGDLLLLPGLSMVLLRLKISRVVPTTNPVQRYSEGLDIKNSVLVPQWQA